MKRSYTLKDKRLPKEVKLFHRSFDGMYIVIENGKIAKKETPRGPKFAYDGITKEDAIKNYFNIFECQECKYLLEWILTEKANKKCCGTVAFCCKNFEKRKING